MHAWTTWIGWDKKIVLEGGEYRGVLCLCQLYSKNVEAQFIWTLSGILVSCRVLCRRN